MSVFYEIEPWILVIIFLFVIFAFYHNNPDRYEKVHDILILAIALAPAGMWLLTKKGGKLTGLGLSYEQPISGQPISKIPNTPGIGWTKVESGQVVGIREIMKGNYKAFRKWQLVKFADLADSSVIEALASGSFSENTLGYIFEGDERKLIGFVYGVLNLNEEVRKSLSEGNIEAIRKINGLVNERAKTSHNLGEILEIMVSKDIQTSLPIVDDQDRFVGYAERSKLFEEILWRLSKEFI